MQCFSRITFNEHQTESPLLFAKSKTTKKKKKKKRKKKKERKKKENRFHTELSSISPKLWMSVAMYASSCGRNSKIENNSLF